MRAFYVSLVAAVVSVGCGGAELPEGWEDAEQLRMTQSACGGDVYDSDSDWVQVNAYSEGVDIVYKKASFRCEQEVEGFVKIADGRIDVLFQPKEMNPSSVARCNCAYDLSATFTTDSGTYDVTVYKRDDSYGSDAPSAPVKKGSVTVTVP